MTIIVPTKITADPDVYRRSPITAADIKVAAENAHYAYASAGLQTVLAIRQLELGVTTSYEVIAKAYVAFGGQRELRGLVVSWLVFNADVQIVVKSLAGATLSTTTVVSTSTTGEGSATITGPGASHPAVIVEVQARQNSSAGAERIYHLRVWEWEHNASTLPSS